MNDQSRPPFNRLLDPVPWAVFLLAATIATAAFGSLSSKVGQGDRDRETILVQLSQIQADLKSLDLRMSELRQDLKEAR